MSVFEEQIKYINLHLNDIGQFKQLINRVEISGRDAEVMASMKAYFNGVEKQLLDQLDNYSTLKLVQPEAESNEQV